MRGSKAPVWVESLLREPRSRGVDARVVLPPAAVAVLLLGTGPACGKMLEALAGQEDPQQAVRDVLEASEEAVPFLQGHLGALLDQIRPGEEQRVTLSGILAALARLELHELVETPGIAGDLLGPLYSYVMAPADRKGRGAFYTPPSLAGALAALVEIQPFESVSEPCVGTGGLVIAAIRSMRRAGRAPELVHWHLQDLDVLALALAGVQVAAHGIPMVTLTHGSALEGPPVVQLQGAPDGLSDSWSLPLSG